MSEHSCTSYCNKHDSQLYSHRVNYWTEPCLNLEDADESDTLRICQEAGSCTTLTWHTPLPNSTVRRVLLTASRILLNYTIIRQPPQPARTMGARVPSGATHTQTAHTSITHPPAPTYYTHTHTTPPYSPTLYLHRWESRRNRQQLGLRGLLVHCCLRRPSRHELTMNFWLDLTGADNNYISPNVPMSFVMPKEL